MFLCVDLGKSTGWVVADNFYQPFIMKRSIFSDIYATKDFWEATIRTYDIQQVFYEEVVSMQFRFAFMRFVERRLMLLEACRATGVEVTGFPVSSLKKSFTGNGRAKKDAIIAQANAVYGVDLGSKEDDIADALSVLNYASHQPTGRDSSGASSE